MSNHYHLAIETPQANLAARMQWLQNTFTRRFNVRHRAWGRVFGDRYSRAERDRLRGSAARKGATESASTRRSGRLLAAGALRLNSPQPGAGGDGQTVGRPEDRRVVAGRRGGCAPQPSAAGLELGHPRICGEDAQSGRRNPAREFARTKGSDPRKVALARLLWERNKVGQGWLAEGLQMDSAANVSQQLRRPPIAATPPKRPLISWGLSEYEH